MLVLAAAGAARGGDPAASLVVFAADRGIHVVATDARGRRTLTRHAPTGPVVAASRDGRAVFFSGGEGNRIWRVDLATRRATPIGPDRRRLSFAAVSPTGRLVAGYREPFLEIWTSDGRRLQSIRAFARNAFALEPPVWSADERRLAFAVDPFAALGHGGVYVATVGRDGVRRTAHGAFAPAWGPGGRLAALTPLPGRSDCPCEAVVGDAMGLRRTGRRAAAVGWTGSGELIVLTAGRLLVGGREVARRVAGFFGTSPRGRFVLGRRRGRLVVIPTRGGPDRALPVSASESALWAANGEIVFDNEFGELFAVRAAGGGGRRQLTRQVADAEPVLSPTGREVAFTRTTPRGSSVWIAAVAGRRPRRLTDGSRPQWSRDGEDLIVSDGSALGEDTQLPLYVVSRDGDRRRWFARGSSARWSPDGSHIAFLTRRARSGRSGTSFRRVLWVVRADGRERRGLRVVRNTLLFSPAWLGDGDAIGYGEDRELYIVDVRTRRRTRLHALPPGFVVAGTDLTVSPDGEWLAFRYARFDERYDYAPGLRIVRRDGALRRVLVPDGADVRSVVWLRSGEIVYERCKPGCALYAIPVGGRGAHRQLARL
jgi:Tol biopolymer transport system component